MKRSRITPGTILTIAIVLVIIISTYIMSRSSYEDESYKISVVLENSSSETWDSFKSGAENAASDYNVILNFVNSGEYKSIDDEVMVIDKQVQSGAQAVMTELVKSKDTADIIKDISGRTVLLLVETGAQSDVDIEGRFATVAADNYQIGRALGNEVLLRHQNAVSGLKVGIVAGSLEKQSTTERIEGLMDTLGGQGGNIEWQLSVSEGQTKVTLNGSTGSASSEDLNTALKSLYKKNPVDIMIATDDDCLTMAGDLFGEIENLYVSMPNLYQPRIDEDGNELSPFELYGCGSATRNLAFIDRGRIVSMIVPNEFRMGYDAVAACVNRLEHKLTPMSDETIEFRVINRENMFKDDNQKYLFTNMQ